MPKIKVNGTILDIPATETLARALAEHGYAASFSCGGGGRCGKCKVKLLNSGMTASTTSHPVELELLTEAELSSGVRLACYLPVTDGMELAITTPGAAQIATDMALTGLNEHEVQRDTVRQRQATRCGLAIDIGTTTIAMYLSDLDTGDVIKVCSALNRQKSVGDDVITRISYTMGNPVGTEHLRRLLLDQLNTMLCELACDCEISSVVISANTVMTHFLLGVSAASIAVAPFTPAFTELIRTGHSRVPLDIGKADITIMPAISGYVGGDIVSGIFYTEIYKSEKLKLLIDLGTNGEMALGNKDKICACAVAAGPAFEGGHIECGSGGVEGAIDSFKLSRFPQFTTIGGTLPIGICGSGIIDIVSELVYSGIIDETGFLDPAPYQLAKGVYLTGRDVREVQLAKAAVAAGVQCLIRHFGADISDVDEVYLAGGFGSYMRAESATKIKLISPELNDRILSAGNTSAGGALKLLHERDFKTVEEIKARTEYLELSGHTFFQEQFIEEMVF